MDEKIILQLTSVRQYEYGLDSDGCEKLALRNAEAGNFLSSLVTISFSRNIFVRDIRNHTGMAISNHFY
jgi:hypothetical protein